MTTIPLLHILFALGTVFCAPRFDRFAIDCENLPGGRITFICEGNNRYHAVDRDGKALGTWWVDEKKSNLTVCSRQDDRLACEDISAFLAFSHSPGGSIESLLGEPLSGSNPRLVNPATEGNVIAFKSDKKGVFSSGFRLEYHSKEKIAK